MITEDDLFDIFSDSHFMRTHNIKTWQLTELVSTTLSDLEVDSIYQNLISTQLRIEKSICDYINNIAYVHPHISMNSLNHDAGLQRLVAAQDSIEESISNHIADAINNIVSAPEVWEVKHIVNNIISVSPTYEVQTTMPFEMPLIEQPVYLSGTN